MQFLVLGQHFFESEPALCELALSIQEKDKPRGIARLRRPPHAKAVAPFFRRRPTRRHTDNDNRQLNQKSAHRMGSQSIGFRRHIKSRDGNV